MSKPCLRVLRLAETRRPSGSDEPGSLEQTLSRVEVLEGGAVIFSCKGLELPDRRNESSVSRIPAGTYVCETLPSSPAFDYEHLWFHDAGQTTAAGRPGIKGHIANHFHQLEGCLAVGYGLEDVDGDRALDVLRSEEALTGLLEALPQRTTCEIVNKDDVKAAAARLAETGVDVELARLSPTEIDAPHHPPSA